jgi:hypothetical protein
LTNVKWVVLLRATAIYEDTTLTTKRKETAPPKSAVAPEGVRRTTNSPRKRALAREHPEMFPEVSSSQLLSDLEDPNLEDEG